MVKQRIYISVFFICSFLCALWICFSLRVSFVQGESMVPTLSHRSFVFINMNKNIEKNDIGVFRAPWNDKIVIKRIIATDGDSIEARDNKIQVNGITVRELPYRCVRDKMKVEGVVLMGDNPASSKDGVSLWCQGVNESPAVPEDVLMYSGKKVLGW